MSVHPGTEADADAATGPSPSAPHTPGPWRPRLAWRSLDWSVSVHRDTGDLDICAVMGGLSGWAAETEANARLISVAPEMASLLREVAGVFRSYEGMHRAKRTAEAERKAVANGVLAQRCEDLLARASAQ